MDVHPLVLEPIYKPRLWGGRRLHTLFGRSVPSDQPIGESWEVADLPNEQSIVTAGPSRGQTLHELVKRWDTSLIGDASLCEGAFPLLIKYLDAAQPLSVQVHPDEATARKMGGSVRSKHEAWYVIDAAPNAVLYKGLRSGVTQEQFTSAMVRGCPDEVLLRIPARVGEVHEIQAGTVHALGAGVMVAEVQTPSDTTFRLFDWNRIDSHTGRPREMHLEQALRSIHFEPVAKSMMKQKSAVATAWGSTPKVQVECLGVTEDFVIDRVILNDGVDFSMALGELVIWMTLSGLGRLLHPVSGLEINVRRWDTVVFPAAVTACRWISEGPMEALVVTLPHHRH